MIDWGNLSAYLGECDNFAAEKMEDTTAIHHIDESVTAGLAGLREVYDLDLDDEATIYALLVGFCVAYKFGCSTAMANEANPIGAQMYLRFHGPISGNVGLVARTLVKNLGVSIPSE